MSHISFLIYNVSDMADHMEMFDYIPDTCKDNLSEMVTYDLLAGENTLGNGDENNNNFIDNVVYIDHNNQNISKKVKSEDNSDRNKFTRKAKRGRPCAKPPTKETLR